MNKIYVLGSINMDLTISVERMPKRGETLSGNSFFTNGGGKGANQAVACARQGVGTRLIGSIGADAFAHDLLEGLNRYGVDTHFVSKVSNTSSGVAMVIIDANHDNRIILDGGANLCITQKQIDTALADANPGDILITQLENNIDAVQYALCYAKEHGLITIFNPAPAIKLSRDIYKNVDVLIVNETECEILSDIQVADESSMLQAYLRLAEFGVTTLVITLGERGAVCFSNGAQYKQEALSIDAIDTTAAGDTFVGTLASGIAKGINLQSSLKYSTVASALACCKRGAQCSIPSYDEVRAYAETMKIDI